MRQVSDFGSASAEHRAQSNLDSVFRKFDMNLLFGGNLLVCGRFVFHSKMAEGLGPPLCSTVHRVISAYLKDITKIGQCYRGFIDGEQDFIRFLSDFSAVSSNVYFKRKSVERQNERTPDSLVEGDKILEEKVSEEEEPMGNEEEKKEPQRRLNKTEGMN